LRQKLVTNAAKYLLRWWNEEEVKVVLLGKPVALPFFEEA
jgi:hypothetical protein